ncbi:MAG: Asp-tRNA(Asn)/Glu-tRNA(Gln) amidotransferase subunit GatA [Legionella sp.]
MDKLSLQQLIKGLHQREFSSVELTNHFLRRIEASKLNAFISIDKDYALQSAINADRMLQHGNGFALTGIPLAHKDIFCTTTMKTTCGSKMLANFYAPYQATIVKRLADHGTVLIGKTNMDEFAMGSTNENSFFGAAINPWNTQRVTGGSSGGSAAAVAAGLVPFATGSDTGGSIRQPASFCGISGLKPTYGLVSRYGMVAYASSFDQAGPMARSAEDLAYILECMAGFDELDSTSVAQPLPIYSQELNKPLESLRIGIPKYLPTLQIDPDIQQAMHSAIHILEQAGAVIIELEFSTLPLWLPCYYVLACAEASSNLSRYDGLRFGYQSEQAETLEELISQTRSQGFGLEVKRRILTGTYVLSSGHYNDYYVQAQKVRRMIQQELADNFTRIDVILGPTTPTCAFQLGTKVAAPSHRYFDDIFTVAANLAGLPAISIPAGFSHKLPIGLQLMGKHFSEAQLLNIAHYYQQQTDWHTYTPYN